MSSQLPELNEAEMGQIALKLLTVNIKDHGLYFVKKPNDSRREIASLAKQAGIDPNKLLSFMKSIYDPLREAVFKPITSEDVAQYEKEQEEKRAQRKAAAAQTQGNR